MKNLSGKLFTTLFFGVFAAVAVFFLCWQTLPMLYKWQQAKSWQATPAFLISHELKINSGDDTDTYKAVAKYRFKFNGKTYKSDQVSLSNMSDNIGSFHQDLNSKLYRIKLNRGEFTVWVNPDNPNESLINRDLRIGILLFNSAFIVIFGIIGFGGILYGLFQSKKQTVLDVNPDQPWLSRSYWSSPVIEAGGQDGIKFLAIFAAIWTTISLMPLYMGIQEITKGNLKGLIACLFFAIGLFLFYLCWTMRSKLKYSKQMPLTLDPYPASIGGSFGGKIDIPATLLLKPNSSEVLISCIRHYKSGDDLETDIVWKRKVVPTFDHTSTGQQAVFHVELPDDLPVSMPDESYPYKAWEIEFSGESKNGKSIKSSYENIPVFATAQQSKSISNIEIQESKQATQQQFEKSANEKLNFTYQNMTPELHYPMFRNPFIGGMFTIIGTIFTVVGLLIPDMVFKIIFPLLGGLAALGGLYGLLNSLTIRFANEGIYTKRRLLGVPVSKKFIPSYSFSNFSPKKSYSVTSGNDRTQYYNITADRRDGKKVVVAEGFESLQEAEIAIEILKQKLPY